MAPLVHCCGVGVCIGDNAEKNRNHTNKLTMNECYTLHFRLVHLVPCRPAFSVICNVTISQPI